MKIEYPNLHGSPEEQLRQLKSWLYRLVEQLNLSLDRLENS